MCAGFHNQSLLKKTLKSGYKECEVVMPHCDGKLVNFCVFLFSIFMSHLELCVVWNYLF